MPNVQQEREHLARAEQRIAEAEQRVAAQIALIERLTEQGQHTTEAKQLLQTFEQILEGWYAHRQLILDQIARG